MNQYDTTHLEVSHITLWPIVRMTSVIFAVIGLIVGVFAFLIFPHPSSAGLTFSTRFLSALLFAVLYTLIVSLGLGLIVWLYNVLSAKFGWAIRLQTNSALPPKK